MRASLSLDLDNLWSYLKTHGDPAWEDHPSYLGTVIPHLLELTEGTAITVFVVGHDAARAENRDLLGSVAAAGHEIGNHSFRHEPWIHTYPDTEVVEELRSAHDAIVAATGRVPVGFRGPGFSVSPVMLQILSDMGYRYDASTLPTWIGPLARRYYFRSTRLSPTEATQRSALFGSATDVTKPNTPYLWDLAPAPLAEIPVTTMPLLRVPIHVSYLLYISEYSRTLAEAYLRTALRACRVRRVGPSILLHPLDLLGGDEIGSLGFFPGMKLPGDVKRRRTARYVDMVRDRFTVGTMADHLTALEPLDRTRRP